MNETPKKYYYCRESKTCPCGAKFSERLKGGNPYKYCPVCRQKKWNELLKISKGMTNK
jgi:hypothetical protein